MPEPDIETKTMINKYKMCHLTAESPEQWNECNQFKNQVKQKVKTFCSSNSPDNIQECVNQNMSIEIWQKPKYRKTTEPVFNADFNSHPNLEFQEKVLNEYHAPKDKAIVFLPCASGKKSRKEGKGKIFADSQSHQYMSAITKEKDLERIVISEPLVAVPYSLQTQMPDYNFPIDKLTEKDRIIFTERLAKFLKKLKREEPERERVYYLGGSHHANILTNANQKAGYPFELETFVNPKGNIAYAYEAKRMRAHFKNIKIIKGHNPKFD